MKKYKIFIVAVAVFFALVIGLNVQKNIMVQEKNSAGEVSLRINGQEVRVPYLELGITKDELSRIRTSGKSDSFLASIFSADDSEKQQPKRGISIDTKRLAHAVVTMFPSLSLPEDAHTSFYVTSENQKIKPTFDVRKLAAQLEEEVDNPGGSAIEVEQVPENLEEKKKEFAGKEVIIKLEGDDLPTLEWKISADVALDKEKLENYFQEKILPKVNRPVKNASIKQFVDAGKVAHIDVDGVAQNGVEISVKQGVKAVRDAILAGKLEVFLQPRFEFSTIVNESGVDLGSMNLLAVGRSNFVGSPEGRAFNIRKGLNEKMNNIIVPPGAKFSFNSFLGPITLRAGWKNALGIFGGKNLVPTPGGGLCQVSTTVYRAALLAGLPITERRPHSLYVNYYKKFGEGLDSTIFSTGPDLVFTNDTPSYIFVQSYSEGNDAYVKIYGTSDERMATLEGPYRSHDIPQEKGYIPSVNEIVWFRNIVRASGENQEEMISSRYRAIPRHPSR